MDYDKGGVDSEWNEGNLKSKRLDEIQELINYYKMNPLGFTNGKFHYDLLEKAINTLYGEGRSWYSDDEQEEVDKLKDKCKSRLRFMCPHIKVKNQSLSDDTTSFLFNEKNYNKLMEALDEFENRVKDLNNEHGLSSKNRDEDEGL